MLFNSYVFLFIYLPVTFAGFMLLGRLSRPAAVAWLFGASLVFYASWDARYLALLLGSITFNYAAGRLLVRCGALTRAGRLALAASVGANLLLLGYYKYANFFVDSVAAVTGWPWTLQAVILPLGISFFTFTQIAYLVDTYRGEVREANYLHYGLFVTYFPHLIAGPVLHHKEMMPQFGAAETYRIDPRHLSVGLTLLAIGLFKKVLIADGIGPFAGPVFDAAERGEALGTLEAWGGALAYTFQLYFDFSAYSDMAIGLSLLFGIRLPLNFDSPYKAASIIDFWRRWHMTLSRFLRDYLYISLGGNRHGKARRHLNLFLTMLLGGLWHGAGWTFVVWGALHGVYLMINHAWRFLVQGLGRDPLFAGPFGRVPGVALTFLAVVVAWVFFRAHTLDGAWHLLQAMAGLGADDSRWTVYASLRDGASKLRDALLLCALVVWTLPNAQQLLHDHRPALQSSARPARWQWRPNLRWFLFTVVLLVWSLKEMGGVSEFLYFQF